MLLLWSLSFGIVLVMNRSIVSTSSLDGPGPDRLYQDILFRNKRFIPITFPNSSVYQFNLGFGMPTAAEHTNLNIAFQANFQLPWNRSQVPSDILQAYPGYDGDSRSQRDLAPENKYSDFEDNSKLTHFYQYVEGILNGYGVNGTACVLKTICQLASEPLHSDDEEDILHEIVTYLLNPTNEVDIAGEVHPYVAAYQDGRDLEDCAKIYESCTLSPADVFTRLHDSM